MRDGVSMKLEFWLDYLNPLCYKQHQSIELLFKKYKFNDLELLYRSYEMIPMFEPEEGCSFYDILAKHHVISLEEAKDFFPDLYESLKPVKVTDVHRLSHLAKKSDKAFEFNQKVFKSYYEDKLDISQKDILMDIALSIGLDQIQVEQVLSSTMFEETVNLNRENAILKGIFELPHIRIDGKIRLSGYHDDSQLLEALMKSSAQFNKTDYCEGENCERKKTR
jgi:predicted DsbA family dithiol-disulfide isomerase